ncbi:MAG: amidohydrolase family protein [Acidobacteria bacterium]|nr:amidohydrolase family protein [Acidobacteriota bacterium]
MIATRVTTLLAVGSLVLVAAATGTWSRLSAQSPAAGGDLMLVNASIIDGTGGDVRRDRYVLVKNGRIQAIGDMVSAPTPATARLIDLKGRFVIPGFIGMHEHVTFLRRTTGPAQDYDLETSRQLLRILIQHGITTVRNPSAPTVEGVALRREVAEGRTLGPRIYTSGWLLNDARMTEEEIKRQVRSQAEARVDFVKVYAALPPELVTAAIDEANRQKVRVIGHLQRTTWTEAAKAGIHFITHGAPWSVQYLPPEKRALYEEAMRREGAMKARIKWLEWLKIDGPEITSMVEELARRKISVDPTLVAYDTKFRGNSTMYLHSPDLGLVPPAMMQSWRRGTFVDDWTPDDFRRGHQVWPKMLALTKRLFDGGVLLTAGSDVPNPWVVPGAGFHRELELLVDAGIRPRDVLRIATSNGAEALGILAETGTVTQGKRADLVVLRGNPLEDIRHTRAIDFVFQNGVEVFGGAK